jgi:hypothetical protein
MITCEAILLVVLIVTVLDVIQRLHESLIVKSLSYRRHTCAI